MNRFCLFNSGRRLGIASLALLAACAADAQDAPSSDLPVATSDGVEPQHARARHAWRRWARGSMGRGAEAPAPTIPTPTPAPTTTTPTPAPTTTTPTPAPTTTAPTPAPTTPPPPPTVKTPYRGVNLEGADFGGALPGTYGTDYTFPTTWEVDYFTSKGMTAFRIGFRWERLQRTAYGDFDATYFSRLDSIVTYATTNGAYVLLNPQNFARYYGNLVGSSQVPNSAFADFWKRLAAKYTSNPKIMFGLVNEPNTMPTEQWVSAANAAIQGIRSTGATNVITVPGSAWTGAWSWYSSSYGTPNAVALLKIVDPADNVLFEAHQYMDSNASGGSDQCISTTVGSERLAPFIKWLRDNHKKGIIGEFAGGRNATCYTAMKNMVSTIHAASDVLEGWLWWGGGPWWGEYQFALDPKDGVDRPQMDVLEPFLVW